MQIEEVGSSSQTFNFDVIKSSFPQDKLFDECLKKWGIEKSLQVNSFRFDLKFDELHSNQFILDLFRHENVKAVIPYVQYQKEYFSDIKFEKLNCNQVKMDMFDKLVEKGIVVKDVIKKRFEEYFEEVEISDLLRESILLEESEHYEVFNDQDRNQLLFRLFKVLVLGGQLCQYEDTLTPYLNFTKLLYKSLVTARKDPINEQVYIDSLAYEVTKIDKIFSVDHVQKFIYVVVNPSLRQVNIIQNEWIKIW